MCSCVPLSGSTRLLLATKTSYIVANTVSVNIRLNSNTCGIISAMQHLSLCILVMMITTQASGKSLARTSSALSLLNSIQMTIEELQAENTTADLNGTLRDTLKFEIICTRHTVNKRTFSILSFFEFKKKKEAL